MNVTCIERYSVQRRMTMILYKVAKWMEEQETNRKQKLTLPTALHDEFQLMKKEVERLREKKKL